MVTKNIHFGGHEKLLSLKRKSASLYLHFFKIIQGIKLVNKVPSMVMLAIYSMQLFNFIACDGQIRSCMQKQ